MAFDKNTKQLRTGFTTGACAAAAARAAWITLNSENVSEELNVLFPDGQNRIIKIFSSEKKDNYAEASVIKTAGDDPDVTDGAKITAKLCKISRNEILSEDFVEKCGEAEVVIRGGKGVGRVTRKGLDVPEKKWAVNPIPRKMIVENLSEEGAGNRHRILLVDISVKNGTELAAKTLNPMIGIEGGISILGTSGIVYPYSHSAYIDTIKILVRGAKLERAEKIVFCTGGRTLKAAERDFPEISKTAFIRIADFISEALEECNKYGFREVVIACMQGKFFKYAMGHSCTHAHRNRLDPSQIRPFLEQCSIPVNEIEKAVSSLTISEAMKSLNKQHIPHVLDGIAQKALENLNKWGGKVRCSISLYDMEGKNIGNWN